MLRCRFPDRRDRSTLAWPIDSKRSRQYFPLPLTSEVLTDVNRMAAAVHDIRIVCDILRVIRVIVDSHS